MEHSRALELLRDLREDEDPDRLRSSDLDREAWNSWFKNMSFVKEAMKQYPNAVMKISNFMFDYEYPSATEMCVNVLRDSSFLLECVKLHGETIIASIFSLRCSGIQSPHVPHVQQPAQLAQSTQPTQPAQPTPL